MSSVKRPEYQADQGSLLSQFGLGRHQYTNENRDEKGWVYGKEVGRIPHHALVHYSQTLPVKSLFLHIPTNLTQLKVTLDLKEDIENYQTVEIHQIQINGIVGVHDVLMLRFLDDLKVFSHSNIGSDHGNGFFISINGATDLVQQFTQGTLLTHVPDLRKLRKISTELMDLNGNKVVYDDIYIWLKIHTASW